ncbi:uncharacterized protein PRCAT00000205001 [Priceomyces carsonii]|uniref:uncharacterized protein n=1 Tax=Priceomyces carsonii TaxID=28549 RepID=UPI002EDA6A83|nr:unnamed protein product [Priceomyces carsonii]
MVSLSGPFSDSATPLSPNEVPRSASPHIIKPPTFPNKQRSSSTNSITSNHSIINANSIIQGQGNTRRTSIVSLDSPRNSIVSIDDIRPTRNSSLVSLTSLTSQAAGTASSSNVNNNKPVKKHNRSGYGSAVVLSDDESDVDLVKTAFRTLPKTKRRRSSERSPVETLENFNFSFDDEGNRSHNKSPRIVTSSIASPPLLDVNDFEPSNTLLQQKGGVKHNKKATLSRLSIFLKKKIYSKDLQLELLNHNSHLNGREATESKFFKKKNLLNSKNNTNYHSELSESYSELNKLINDLNQKWNKSSNESQVVDISINSKKRSRGLFEDDTE